MRFLGGSFLHLCHAMPVRQPHRGHPSVVAALDKLEKARLYLVRNARPAFPWAAQELGLMQVRQSGPRSFIVRDEETVRCLGASYSAPPSAPAPPPAVEVILACITCRTTMS